MIFQWLGNIVRPYGQHCMDATRVWSMNGRIVVLEVSIPILLASVCVSLSPLKPLAGFVERENPFLLKGRFRETFYQNQYSPHLFLDEKIQTKNSENFASEILSVNEN